MPRGKNDLMVELRKPLGDAAKVRAVRIFRYYKDENERFSVEHLLQINNYLWCIEERIRRPGIVVAQLSEKDMRRDIKSKIKKGFVVSFCRNDCQDIASMSNMNDGIIGDVTPSSTPGEFALYSLFMLL